MTEKAMPRTELKQPENTDIQPYSDDTRSLQHYSPSRHLSLLWGGYSLKLCKRPVIFSIIICHKVSNVSGTWGSVFGHCSNTACLHPQAQTLPTRLYTSHQTQNLTFSNLPNDV